MQLSSSRLSSALQWSAGVFFSVVILLHAGLIPLGQWQGDEYVDFEALARRGWPALLERAKWSPRPFSEPIFYLYGWLVNHARQPLITPFLAVLWAGLLLAALWTAWQRSPRASQPTLHAGRGLESSAKTQLTSGRPGLLAALALLAYVLTSGPLMEVFYWPAGAVAYLPTLAASLLLFFQIATGRLETSPGRRLCSACLLVAACSSETGAILAATYALLQAGQAGWRAMRARSAEEQPEAIVGFAWWLVPGAVSFVLLLALRLNRYNVLERPAAGDFSAAGRPLLSALLGLEQFLRELLRSGAGVRHVGFVGPRIVAVSILAAGIGMLWSRLGEISPATRRQVGLVCAAFLISAWLSITVSELHFGAVCCSRHETLRRCWLAMALAGITIMLFAHRKSSPRFSILAPVLLCVGVVMPWHAKLIVQQYRTYRAQKEATAQNFRSGFAQGGSRMTYLVPPVGTIITGAQVEPGTYTLDDRHAEYPLAILEYFGKQSLEVRGAKDWLPRHAQQ